MFNPPKSALLEPDQPPNFFYRGFSMRGTFKPGDKLITEKVPFGRIKKGDVIIFRRTRENQSDFIVHRVVEITLKGLVTRGDNCYIRDIDPINEKKVISRVIQYDRWGKVYRVYNGSAGRMRAALLHGRLHTYRAMRFLLKRPYLILRKSSIGAKLWHPAIEIIHLETPNGPMDKYIHKGQTVAIHWVEKNHWHMKRPYDFIFRS